MDSLDNNNNNNIFNLDGVKYTIIKNGQEITDDLYNIAFSKESGDIKNIHLNSDKFYSILFLDGFDQTIHPQFITRRVEYVKLGDIKKPLIKGSLPNGVTDLTLLDGFSQPLSKEVLPEFLINLSVGNIKTKLSSNLLPEIRNKINLLDGFNQLIGPNDLPSKSCKSISIKKIKTPLKKGSIGDGFSFASIGGGFNQEIEVGALPNSLCYLVFGDIDSSVLKAGSIPNVPCKIKFEKDFKGPLSANVIPENCQEVWFETTKEIMLSTPIPEGVVRFWGYDVRRIAGDEGESAALNFQDDEKAYRKSIRDAANQSN